MRLGSPRGSLTLDELEAVYRRDAAAFERVAIAIAGDEQVGRDAVHDAFVHAIRSRRRYRPEAPVAAWIWRIVVNEARKRRARDARSVPTDPRALDPGSVALNGSGDRERVRALLALLPERQRLVLFLRHYADLDYATIADALAIAPGTVGATLNAAHARLRTELEEVHEWEL